MNEPKVLLYTYPNGLRLVAEERPSVRAAAFHLLLPSGAVLDPPDRDGLSKVLLELCYRGAGDYDSRALSDALDGLGVQRFSAAGTETLGLGGALLADKLSEALALHREILLRPWLSDEELPACVALALQELKSLEDNPAQKMFVHLRRAYFLNEYGRSTYGTEESLHTVTAEDCRREHRLRFRPDGAILAVAGRFDWESLRQTIAELFGSWEGAPPSIPAPAYRREPYYHHVEQDTAQEHIGVAFTTVPPDHPQRYVQRILVGVLSGGMSARLFTEVREKRGLAYAVFASTSQLRGHGAVLCYAGTTPERAQETLDVLIGELERLVQGVTEEEVERARIGLLSRLIMQGESTGARAGAIASDLFYLGRVRSLAEIRAGVEAVTPADVVAFLKDHPPAPYVVTTLGPRRLTPPELE